MAVWNLVMDNLLRLWLLRALFNVLGIDPFLHLLSLLWLAVFNLVLLWISQFRWTSAGSKGRYGPVPVLHLWIATWCYGVLWGECGGSCLWRKPFRPFQVNSLGYPRGNPRVGLSSKFTQANLYGSRLLPMVSQYGTVAEAGLYQV